MKLCIEWVFGRTPLKKKRDPLSHFYSIMFGRAPLHLA
jgi:hypothetical protein